MGFLCILDVNPLSDVSFANIFSHSVGGLFIFVDSFLQCAKACQFDVVPFVDFCFCFPYLGDRAKKNISKTNIKEHTVFSSESFMFSGLIFKPLIHFEFIFIYGVRKQSSLILLLVAVQFSHYHLLKRLSFPYCIFLLPCCKLIAHLSVGSFLGSLFCSIDLCVCFCASTILF